jgi:hypothetical protein
MSLPSKLFFLLLLWPIPLVPAQTPSPTPSNNDEGATETIVFVRHGEKPPTEFGQLSCQGLNRALALPKLLVNKYGKADFIFAPDPEKDLIGKEEKHSYVRALATIEPTAIELALPIETRFGFREVGLLQTELLDPKYQGSRIFVAWEHLKLNELVKNVLTFFNEDSSVIPDWKNDDFDSIYVLKVRSNNGQRSISFQHDFEGLNNLSSECSEPSSTKMH